MKKSIIFILLLLAGKSAFGMQDQNEVKLEIGTEEEGELTEEQVEKIRKFLKTYKVEQNLQERFFRTERAEKLRVLLSGEEEYALWKKAVDKLILLLKKDQSDFVLFALGAAEEAYQECPSYLKKLAKQFPGKVFTVYSLDYDNKEAVVKFENITIIRIRTLLPYNDEHKLVPCVEKFVRKKLKMEKVVFIGNYAQGHNVHDVASFFNVYFKIKKSNPNLTFYTQIGEQTWKLFDPNVDEEKLQVVSTKIFFKDLNDGDCLEPTNYHWTEPIKYTSIEFESGLSFDVQEKDGRFIVGKAFGKYKKCALLEVLDN